MKLSSSYDRPRRPKFSGSPGEFVELARSWDLDAKKALANGDRRRAWLSSQLADRFRVKAQWVRGGRSVSDLPPWTPAPYDVESAKSVPHASASVGEHPTDPQDSKSVSDPPADAVLPSSQHKERKNDA